MEKKVEYGRIELAKIQDQLSKNMKEFVKEKKSI
jgi:hypothetical protein